MTKTPTTVNDLINLAGSLIESEERSSAANVLDMMDEGTCDPMDAEQIAALYQAGLSN
jgi:hypothetical protein